MNLFNHPPVAKECHRSRNVRLGTVRRVDVDNLPMDPGEDLANSFSRTASDALSRARRDT